MARDAQGQSHLFFKTISGPTAETLSDGTRYAANTIGTERLSAKETARTPFDMRAEFLNCESWV